jgi:X-Pro dipeptidyl-peptidase
VFTNGMAQVVPAFQDSSRWIRHDLWVETDVDSDRDGRRDRVHVDVTRPGQTESEGLRVPILYGSSPYFAGTSRDDSNWDVNQELGAVAERRPPAARHISRIVGAFPARCERVGRADSRSYTSSPPAPDCHRLRHRR